MRDFMAAFVEGSSFDSEAGKLVVSVRDVGELRVTTGRVLACDPLAGPEDAKPFTERVPAGSYPVRASVARWDEHDDSRIALVVLELSKATPVRWKKAKSYPVELDAGGFMDAAAAKAYGKEGGNALVKAIGAALEESGRPPKPTSRLKRRGPAGPVRAAAVELPGSEGKGPNVVAFSSGFGGGLYTTWYGFDSQDRLACLVTDFEVIERWKPLKVGKPVEAPKEPEPEAKAPEDGKSDEESKGEDHDEDHDADGKAEE